MSPYDYAIGFVLAHEGGFVDHPDDPGGATNRGISLRFLRTQHPDAADIDGDGDIDADDIRLLTEDDARDLYRSRFWDALRLDDLPGAVAAAVFDTAVNCGPGRAVRFLQAACNGLSDHLQLTEDGALGPKTRRGVGIVADRFGEQQLAEAVLWARQDYYNRLAAESRFRPFHLGWSRRVSALRNLIRN